MKSATVALKYQTDNFELCVTFHGSVDEIGASATLYSGLTEDEANAPVSAVVATAAQRIGAVVTLADQLGAVPIAPELPGAPAPARAPVVTATPVVAPAPDPVPAPAPAERDPLAGMPPLYRAVAKAATVAELHQLYGKHKAEFDSDQTLMGSWRARGRHLQDNASNPR